MKKWVFCLVVLFLAGYAAVSLKSGAAIMTMEQPGQAPKGTSTQNGITIKIPQEQIYKGDLLLVNKDYPVPQKGAAAEAVKLMQHKELVQGFGLLDNTIRLSPSLVQKFSAMTEAAAKDGVRHFVISSGYRDNKEQDQLYRQMGADYAMPAGYSEHNLGLSLDIGSTQGEMNQAAEGKWLKKNAWKYGFILRYPKDKTEITGIQYEPWHFRYVGLPHSAIMMDNNWVLEQYLDYLKERKTIKKTIGKTTYEISYYPVSNNTTIQIPANRHYELSGNNMDGIIVTVYP
ncbi:M15 family metallopeptidase [Paenibacillus thalictri]|uniref:D-alanyl-D-alanine carboxypeptidase family protein n=1 Tax=Paenibacillus thalictri TaxID=2527873 RepID=A0A4Q9DQN8_9BACL|nr:M15 family metallopeptidase [Paenibacillus thalictri]TBL77311.1 D-alanyl-D-alanine carboxypeptidase family protein [Paenibacillus thalictri]